MGKFPHCMIEATDVKKGNFQLTVTRRIRVEPILTFVTFTTGVVGLTFALSVCPIANLI